MGKYVLQRLLMTLLVVLVASIVVFTLVFFVPGDPVKIMMSPEATVAELEAKRHSLGLDQPYLVQLGTFLYNAYIKFDLGTSWIRGTPVVDGLMERLPYTFELGIWAILISASIGIPLGVTAAVHQNGWQDRVCMLMGMICTSLPDFWFALLLILLFTQKLNILPAFGIGGIKYMIMPVAAASLKSIGTLARQTRSSMLEVIRSDYITTARAKGLKEQKVIWKHMLPNALIPIITVIGTSFSGIIAGTVVIEQVFSRPGVGTYLTQAITNRDFPITRGCVIILAIFTSVMMLLVDLAYAAVDPRIKAQYAGQSKRRVKNVK
jgi:ABC-type dipeptide/oligopeptide/nickel transport system permease component